MATNRYRQSKVYKIWNDEDDQVYVGSTCKPTLAQRMANHRSHHKNCIKSWNYKIYKHMRKIGIEKFHIELIESYPCNSKDELTKREGYWIRELKATLNGVVAGRNNKEYYKEEKQTIKERHKAYYEAHKEEICNYQKDYRHEVKPKNDQRYVCECGSNIRIGEKSRHNKSKLHQQFIQTDGLNLIEL